MALKPFTDDDFFKLIELVETPDSEWELMNEGQVKVWRRPDEVREMQLASLDNP